MLCACVATLVLLAASPSEPQVSSWTSGALPGSIAFGFEPDGDRDDDDQPDDWSRRKGDGFPHFVRTEIDRTQHRTGEGSLRFDVNGSAAAYYSPPVPVDALHTFRFSGWIKTSREFSTRAVISVSLLNYRRERLQRFLTQPLGTTEDSWAQVALGPIVPSAETAFAVIGCHLVPGDDLDVSGSIWFDDLVLNSHPRLQLTPTSHFVDDGRRNEIDAVVSGLDPLGTYHLHLSLFDMSGAKLCGEVRSLPNTESHSVAGLPASAMAATSFAAPSLAAERVRRIRWELPVQQLGFFHVVAELEANGQMISRQETSLAKMPYGAENPVAGEFGWTVSRPLSDMSPEAFAAIAAQSGLNWMKYPVWDNDSPEATNSESQGAGALFGSLSSQSVKIVGLLTEPPAEYRRKFDVNWAGLAEFFQVSPRVWGPAVQPLISRYASIVRHWQIGRDNDLSFVSLDQPAAIIGPIRKEIHAISRDAHIGLPWQGLPPKHVVGPKEGEEPDQPDFMTAPWPPTAAELAGEAMADLRAASIHRWRHINPERLVGKNPRERSANLVLNMIRARSAGVPVLFFSDVFHHEHGLLTEQGAPREIYLPWRSAASAMQGAESVGAMHFPNQSANAIFARDGTATLFLWNPEVQTDRFYLGPDVKPVDLWGRPVPMQVHAQTQVCEVPVGPEPILLKDCSEPLLRFQRDVAYQRGRMRSQYGAHDDALVGSNPFRQRLSGTVTIEVPKEWTAEPKRWTLNLAAGEKFRLPVKITTPATVSLGTKKTSVVFQFVTDRAYDFRVDLPFRVGLDDLLLTARDRKLPDGRLQIEQLLTNKTSPEEIFDFRCSLYVPGSRRNKLQISKFATGADRRFYTLPSADELRGQELWLRLEQEGGDRVLNYRWIVGQDW